MTVADDKLAGLLARVREATGPDRELDTDLCIALAYISYVPEPLNLRRAEDGWLDYESVEDGHTVQCSDIPPELTASIDAALALVERLLPDWGGAILSWSAGGKYPVFRMERSHPTNLEVAAEAHTRPLAILAAMLSALSHKEPGK